VKYKLKVEKYEIDYPRQRISTWNKFFIDGKEVKQYIEKFVDRFKSYPQFFITFQINEIQTN
jgi:hypothetical protein